MKSNFLYVFFFICSLCSPISHSIAESQIFTNSRNWNSDVNPKTKQLIISSQDNDFIISLAILSGKNSRLRISYLKNSYMIKDITSLKFSIGKQSFILKRNNLNTYSQQTNFEFLLPSQQLKTFIQEFTSKETAYITFNRNVIPISLIGTSSIVSTILQYLDKYPIPELPPPFGKKNTSNAIFLSSFNITHNQLLFGMGGILFLLLLGRPIFKLLASIYRYRKKHYYTNKATKIANSEIIKQANILYIKRDQLLYKDDYGCLIQDKWLQEAHRFIKTKIEPLLSHHKLLQYYPYIQKNVLKRILYIAKYPPKKQKYFFQKIKKTNRYSPKMNPLDYEKYCAELLIKSGWNAKVTTASGDQGADVIAIKKGITLIIQCKLYSKPVGNKAVQEVNAAKTFYHAHYAAVVSNASYTTSARQLAESTKVILLHHETLQDFARNLR